MKHTILLLCVAFAIAGCNRQGREATCDAYDVGRVAACAVCSAMPTTCPWAPDAITEADARKPHTP